MVDNFLRFRYTGMRFYFVVISIFSHFYGFSIFRTEQHTDQTEHFLHLLILLLFEFIIFYFYFFEASLEKNASDQ